MCGGGRRGGGGVGGVGGVWLMGDGGGGLDAMYGWINEADREWVGTRGYERELSCFRVPWPRKKMCSHGVDFLARVHGLEVAVYKFRFSELPDHVSER